MTVIADQNSGKNVGKTICGNEELVFLASVIKEGRTSWRRRLQVQLALKTEDDFWIWLAFHYCLFPKEHHSSSFSSFLSSVSSRSIYFVFFSQKHDSQYATELPAFQTATLSPFSNTEHCIRKWFMHIKQVYFVLSKQEEHIYTSSCSSCHFVPKDKNTVRMTNIGNVQNSG